MAGAVPTARAEISAKEEWRANWGVALAAMVGISFLAVTPTTLGVFMQPLESEFGWSRTLLSSGMTIYAVVALCLTPMVGGLSDSIGARRCVIPGLLLVSLAFASFGLMTGQPWQWWTIWTGYAFCSLLIRSVIWSSGIAKVFTASRGLAISVTLAGLGIAQIIGNPIAHALISRFGWREAYMIMGFCWPGLGLVLVLLFFHSAQERRERSADLSSVPAPTTTPGGLTLRQALKDPTILRIGLAAFLAIGMGAPITIHFVPILESLGTTRAFAATTAGFLGVGVLAGNFSAGWLTDRIRSDFLPPAIIAVPLAGALTIWWSGGNPILLGIGATCIGIGSGGMLQVVIYMTTRYAGLRHFGKIYGVISSTVSFAAGTTPIVSGLIYDKTGSYDLLFSVAAPVFVVAMLLVARLGPYRDYPPETAV